MSEKKLKNEIVGVESLEGFLFKSSQPIKTEEALFTTIVETFT